MQVRVRTNMSDPFPKKIVRERMTEFGLPNSVIRLLRGEIAGFRVLVMAGYRCSVLYWFGEDGLGKTLIFACIPIHSAHCFI